MYFLWKSYKIRYKFYLYLSLDQTIRRVCVRVCVFAQAVRQCQLIFHLSCVCRHFAHWLCVVVGRCVIVVWCRAWGCSVFTQWPTYCDSGEKWRIGQRSDIPSKQTSCIWRLVTRSSCCRMHVGLWLLWANNI